MRILVIRDREVVESRILRRGILTIGRGSPADVVLDDPSVSAQHAAICVIGTNAWVVDNRSTNGTWLNQRKVGRHSLKDGDRIVIGRHTLVVQWRATGVGLATVYATL